MTRVVILSAEKDLLFACAAAELRASPLRGTIKRSRSGRNNKFGESYASLSICAAIPLTCGTMISEGAGGSK
jgi:hypothetical protein